MARTSKSDARKELAGTTRPDRKVTPRPPEPPGNLPPNFQEPPKWLDDEGVRIYWEIARHVQSVQALWGIDHMIIRQAAYWMSLYIKTINESEGEFVQTFATGARQISPQFSIIDKSEAHIKKYFEMLGIGAKSREAIGVFNTTGGSETADPFKLLSDRLSMA